MTNSHDQVSDLYIALAGLPSESGLGYLDTSKAILELEMEITEAADAGGMLMGAEERKGRRRRVSVKTRLQKPRSTTITIDIQQDLSLLKGRKGDTGKLFPMGVVLTVQAVYYGGAGETRRACDRHGSDLPVAGTWLDTCSRSIIIHPCPSPPSSIAITCLGRRCWS